MCVYQAVKLWVRRGEQAFDIESMFMLSTTIMLSVGLAAILITGKWINDITQRGFPHVLRVKQAEVLDKASHFLVEHDFFNGRSLHSTTVGEERRCHHHPDHHRGQYSKVDQELFDLIDQKSRDEESGLGRQKSAVGIDSSRRNSHQLKQQFLEAKARGEHQKLLNEKVENWMKSRSSSQLQDFSVEADQCYKLLDNLIKTCEDEYSGDGARLHWGAEDRCVKLFPRTLVHPIYLSLIG